MVDREMLRKIKVFISHTSVDGDEAVHFKELLERAGFNAWAYQAEPPERGTVKKIVKQELFEADYMFLLVSDASIAAPWVQVELGQALTLIEARRQADQERWEAFNPDEAGQLRADLDEWRRDNPEASEMLPPDTLISPANKLLARPIVIPIWVEKSAWRGDDKRRPTEFPYRYDIEGDVAGTLPIPRGFDPHAIKTDTEAALLAELEPSLRIFGRESDDKDAMDPEVMRATAVFHLYATLFTEDERDDDEDIINWVFERDIGKAESVSIPRRRVGLFRRPPHQFEHQFDSWYPVLTLRRKAVAFAFTSYHLPSRVMYGNYVGVQQAWRGASAADIFWKEIQKKVFETYPECRGLAFEVEPCDFAAVSRIVTRLEAVAAMLPDDGERADRLLEALVRAPNGDVNAIPDEEMIRRYLRIAWYRARGALRLVDADGEPLVNTTPCLTPTKALRDPGEEDDPDEDKEDPIWDPAVLSAGELRNRWKRKEVPFWVGWVPNRKDPSPPPTWREISWFSSVDVLANSVALELAIKDKPLADEYLSYAKDLGRKAITRARGGKSSLARMIPSHHRSLYRRWRDLEIPLSI